jgi:hypothetical protein
MRLMLAILLIGCAADPEPVATKTTMPPPIPTTLTIYERLHDEAGPIAGMPGFSIVHRVDPTFCGGVAVEVKTADAEHTSGLDVALANVLDLRFPRDLDFAQPKKEASLDAFNKWVEHMHTLGAAGRAFYSDQLVAKNATPKERVIAAARIVQLQRHLASTLVRASIPLDVRTGEFVTEKTEAFCDKLEEVAEPIVLAAEGAAKVCLDHATSIASGWWTTVCVLSPSIVTASASPSTNR